MAAEGLLIKRPEGDESYVLDAPCGVASHPDLSHPDARAYVKAALAAAETDLGLDGWMADFAEWLPFDARLHDGSDLLAAHNHYPVEWQRLTRELMDELRPDGNWVMLPGRAGQACGDSRCKITTLPDKMRFCPR
jgi:alpha-glucosidase